VGRTTITRRRALGVGAAAGLASLLARTPLAALARPAAPALGFGLDVGPEDFHGRLSRVLRAPRRFDVLGVRGADAARGVEVRARRAGGSWSPWIPLAVRGDHAPDTGSGERASDPIWFGDGHELQLRVRRRPHRPLRVHMVAVAPSARWRRAAPRALARAAQAAATPGTPPPIIPREVWGTGFAPRTGPAYGQVQVAFVHHTVTANDYAPEQSAGIVLGIAKYHRDTNGWNDIGYNFLVDKYGQVFEGRAGGVEAAVVGAQAQGYNSFSTGVAHLGTYGDVPIGEPALAATAQLLGWKLSLHGVPCQGQVALTSGGGDLNRYPAGQVITFERISGHRDGDATDCPGDALYAQLPALRVRAAALAGPIQAQGQVTLLPAETSVVYGDDAVLTGRVTRPDSTAGAGDRVTIQKTGASGAWVTVAQVTAAPDGSWVARMPWRRAGSVRALAVGLTSPAVRIAMVPRLSARAATKRVHAGNSVRLSGRVRPVTTIRVLIERQGSDGIFRRSRTVQVRVRRSAWQAAVRLRRPGLYRLTPSVAGQGGAAGKPVFVRAVRRRGATGGVSAG
jgi:hypothetical protein